MNGFRWQYSPPDGALVAIHRLMVWERCIGIILVTDHWLEWNFWCKDSCRYISAEKVHDLDIESLKRFAERDALIRML